jgi:hypothetical protein
MQYNYHFSIPLHYRDPYNNQHMGMCGEACAVQFGFTRADQDAYAIQSYGRGVIGALHTLLCFSIPFLLLSLSLYAVQSYGEWVEVAHFSRFFLSFCSTPLLCFSMLFYSSSPLVAHLKSVSYFSSPYFISPLQPPRTSFNSFSPFFPSHCRARGRRLEGGAFRRRSDAREHPQQEEGRRW